MSIQENTNQESISAAVQYESLIPTRKRTVAAPYRDILSNLSSHSPLLSNSGQIVLLDLDNRIERLSRWILLYFIFSITEMIGNAIHTQDNLPSGIITTPYQLWLASDIFLFIGCMLSWFSLHYVPDIPNIREKHDQYFKYIGGGLFILCAILQWIAIAVHNKHNYCSVMQLEPQSYCKSYVFSMHWMGHFFALIIGIDIMDTDALCFLSSVRKIRLLVYCMNIFFMNIIIASDIDYFYKNENEFMNINNYYRNPVEAGYFILSFVCFAIVFALVSSIMMGMVLIDNMLFRKLCGILMLVSCAMILFGINLISHIQPYNIIMAVVPIFMIIYDLQCL